MNKQVLINIDYPDLELIKRINPKKKLDYIMFISDLKSFERLSCLMKLIEKDHLEITTEVHDSDIIGDKNLAIITWN